MRARTLALLLGAGCGNADGVVDDACAQRIDEAACGQCCLDQGYTGAFDVDDDVCECRRQDVGDDPGDRDLR